MSIGSQFDEHSHTIHTMGKSFKNSTKNYISKLTQKYENLKFYQHIFINVNVR